MYVGYIWDYVEYIHNHAVWLGHHLHLPRCLQSRHDVIGQNPVTMVLSVHPDSLWAIQTFGVDIHEMSRSISKPMKARFWSDLRKIIENVWEIITFGSAPAKYHRDMLLLAFPCPPFSLFGVQTCIVAWPHPSIARCSSAHSEISGKSHIGGHVNW